MNSTIISELNNKYTPIKINNILKAYSSAYDTNHDNSDKINMNQKDENIFCLIFDTLTEIKCSEFPIKYIKLSQNASNLICIDSKTKVINLNYDDFFLSKQKFKDKKNITFCNKCNSSINNSKVFCQVCGKKLCSNCKMEMIIAEISLKNKKPICEECFQLINKSNQSLFDF